MSDSSLSGSEARVTIGELEVSMTCRVCGAYGTAVGGGYCDRHRPFTDDQLIDIGLTAAYKIKAGGFLGGNSEERIRVALRTVLEVLRAKEA